MAVDHYALCPCGSGKKIKFCKCASSIDAVEKVMKMVQGGQMVAALDRLNDVLKQHPDAAWALAIKGRLLISLGEYDSVAENADRFMRLQPSNPLALAQKAASEIFRDKTLEGAQFLLQALGEGGQSIDAFLLEISAVLGLSLMSDQNFLSARLYATLPLSNSGYDDVELPQRLLYELNQSPSVNMLLKSLPIPIERPEDAEWTERFDEANALLRSNQVLLAESKFEGLNRQFSGQPAILSGLLTCAIWRTDREAQARYLKQLSAAITDDAEKSARLAAMGHLIDLDHSDLACEASTLEAELENAEEATIAMSAHARTRSLPAEVARSLMEEDDSVPPRAVFAILDKEPPEKDATLSADNMPCIAAVALLYGKQTDRPARLMLPSVSPFQRECTEATLKEVLGDSLNITVLHSEKDSLHSQVSPRLDQVVLQEHRPSREEYDQLAQDLVVRNLRSATLPAFGDRPLEEAAQDPSTLPARTTLVRLLQGYFAYMAGLQGTMDAFAEVLQVPPVPTITPKTDEDLETLSAFDLAFIDPSQLDAEGLEYLLQRAFQVNSPVRERAANCIVTRDTADFESKETVLSAYLTLMGGSDNPEDASKQCEAAKAWCKANDFSTGNVLLAECQMHLRFMNAQGFERCVQEVMRDHGHDPEIMQRLQQMLMQMGLINPDGTPRQGPAGPPPSQQPGELWTGDAPAGPAPGAQQPPAEEGGSKLWLPGMD